MAADCLRLLCMLGALSCLSACAPIVALVGYGSGSPALQIAAQFDRLKLASDGVSYLGSGKTLTDHALSKAAGADCHLLNVVKSEPVCRSKPDAEANKGEQREERVTVAAIHADLLKGNAATMPPVVTGDSSADSAAPTAENAQ